MLFESPFTDLNFGGIMGLFDESTLGKIISLIEQVNRNADVA
jgi:type I restriction enzyme, R subunit